MMQQQKALSKAQISVLERQGCHCGDWSKVTAAEGFEAGRVSETLFAGTVRLGSFKKNLQVREGLELASGIRRATIVNCEIGDDVLIHNAGIVSNYRIGKGAVIANTDEIHFTEGSACGNGALAACVNEAGGREVRLYERLTAQTAYLMAMHRHDAEMIERLDGLIRDYIDGIDKTRGAVGAGARILNCGRLCNVRVGPCAEIDGATLLEETTVNSDASDPASVGAGAVLRECIVCEGAKVSGGVTLSKCFAGQAAELALQFSATNSLFFANSSCYNGEACSAFCGPFTVSHHKSSLLLTAMYSFFNAGSGTNQSNHMYKLGPCHQGILERGTRTASDAYILWPARAGAFSLVKGRHMRNFDTTDLPFSYILEDGGESTIVPGACLRNVGIARNEVNWRKRDRRNAEEKLDQVNPRVFSARTAEKIMRAAAMLRAVFRSSSEDAETTSLCGLKARRTSLPKAAEQYESAADAYLGGVLAARLEKSFPRSAAELAEIFNSGEPAGDWLDVGGMIAPRAAVAAIEEDLKRGGINTEGELRGRFASLHSDYQELEWRWVASILLERMQAAGGAAPNSAASILHKWHASVKHLNTMRLADACKEFSSQSMTGYGADGGEECKAADFSGVRGDYESNGFVAFLKEETARTEERSRTLSDRLAALG